MLVPCACGHFACACVLCVLRFLHFSCTNSAAAAAVRIRSSVSHRPSGSQALCFVAATVQQQSHVKLCPLRRPRKVNLCACAYHLHYRNEQQNNLKRGGGVLRRG